MATTTPLSPDQLSNQISILSLLLAMFPSATEREISSSDSALIANLSESLAEVPLPSALPAQIALAIQIAIDDSRTVRLNITAPLTTSTPDEASPPDLVYSLRQPPFLSRAQHAALVASLPSDLFSVIEDLPSLVRAQLEAQAQMHADPSSADATSMSNSNTAKGRSSYAAQLLRVAFYFPSLSTRAKRDDLVQWAPSHGLTGFVLAGKPGLLVLEGSAQGIDDYMNEIKTVSWGDIPSHQKKVSERWRKAIDARVFGDMSEITDLVEKRGARGNRGDMGFIEAWLRERNLGDLFEGVILGS